jgi:plasmid stabilization system protein ParE
MEFKVIVSKRAQAEIEHAIAFYAEHSAQSPKAFIIALEQAFQILAISPYFAIAYKQIRSIPLQKFPFALFYTINKENNTIEIRACFHHKRNPLNRPKK